MRRGSLALALAAVLALLRARRGAATLAGRQPRPTSGPGSLGETILEAGPGDTIEIPPGTYLLTNGDTLVAQQNIAPRRRRRR